MSKELGTFKELTQKRKIKMSGDPVHYLTNHKKYDEKLYEHFAK
jgi:hypothetical protein